MAEQQPQPMQQEAELIHLFRNVAQEISGVHTTTGAQGVAKITTSYQGDPKQCKEWIKSIEKYAILTQLGEDQRKLVAYQASKGAVSDFIKRYLQDHPRRTWQQLQEEKILRFSEVTVQQHALMLLRKVRQREGESVQVYAERIMSLAEDAFGGQGMQNQAIQDQLIGFFTDGLSQDFMKMKVMRDNPRNFQAAVDVSLTEQNLRKRFNLRSGKRESDWGNSSGHQPMEVDHVRPVQRCFECNKKGHIAQECRSRPKVNVVQGNPQARGFNIICWGCNKRRHILRDCRQEQSYGYGNQGPSRWYQGTSGKRHGSFHVEADGRGKNISTCKICLAGNANSCLIKVEKQKFRALVDSGADISLIRRDVYDSLKTKPTLIRQHTNVQSGTFMTL